MMNSYGKGVRLAALGLATAATLSLAAPAFAANGATGKPAQDGRQESAGMTVAVDAHGKLRQPTAAENRALAAGIQGLTKSAADVQVNRTPDGTMSVDLTDTFLNISMAQIQPDGTVRQVCVDSAADANAVLNNTPVLEEK
jgi:hypothetical protein